MKRSKHIWQSAGKIDVAAQAVRKDLRAHGTCSKAQTTKVNWCRDKDKECQEHFPAGYDAQSLSADPSPYNTYGTCI